MIWHGNGAMVDTVPAQDMEQLWVHLQEISLIMIQGANYAGFVIVQPKRGKILKLTTAVKIMLGRQRAWSLMLQLTYFKGLFNRKLNIMFTLVMMTPQLSLTYKKKFPMRLKNSLMLYIQSDLYFQNSTQQKFPGCSSLSVKVISYLAKCFGYCVAQNKNNPEALQTAIRNIVPHAFGKHENCSETWCQFKKDPTIYRLLFGNDLHGDDLEKALTKVFEDYSTDIVVKKLAPATNSQQNEAFNNVVGSKTPKIRFYGGSASNDFRVACGVSQTNEGHSYICKTLKEVNIEPGSHCTTFNKAVDVKSSKEKMRKSSILFKKRRSQSHRAKLGSNARSEAREGATYQTNVGLNLDATKDDSIAKLLKLAEQLEKTRFQEYESMVPPFKTRPKQPKISYNEAISYQFVVFDIETTGLSKQTQICQLAPITKEGKIYNEYVLPTCHIDHHASRINKLSVKVVNGQRTLLKANVPVHSVLLSECLQNFTTFLFHDKRIVTLF